MKKILLVLVLIPLMLSVGITGCSKDKDDNGGGNNVTGPPVDPFNFEFVLEIMNADEFTRDGERGWFWLYFVWYGGLSRDGIESASITIDGTPVDLDNWYGDWSGEVELNVGQSYNLDITYNNTENQNFDFIALGYPEMTWPNTYTSAEEMTLNWILAENAENQFFLGWGEAGYWDENDEWVTEDEDDDYKELALSARDWTVPANWLKSGLDFYSFELVELNYIKSGDFLAMSSGISFMTYGEMRDDEIKVKRHTEQLIKIVKGQIQ